MIEKLITIQEWESGWRESLSKETPSDDEGMLKIHERIKSFTDSLIKIAGELSPEMFENDIYAVMAAIYLLDDMLEKSQKGPRQ